MKVLLLAAEEKRPIQRMHFGTFLGSSPWDQRAARKVSELVKTLVDKLLRRSIKGDSACSVNYLVKDRIINDRACCGRRYHLSE
jgi:hypothetical protein